MINIKEKRKQANITQSELAASIGVGQSAVAMWETGASHPRVELLPKIASVLNCTVDDLLKQEDSSMEKAYLTVKDIQERYDYGINKARGILRDIRKSCNGGKLGRQAV